VALAVAVEEELGFDHAVGVDQERAGVGDAVGFRAGRDLAVADAVGVDRRASLVREQREGDGTAFGETRKRVDGIKAEDDDLQARLEELFLIVLQLDQLPDAEGSPLGRTGEDEGDRAGLEQVGEGTLAAGLIGEREAGGDLADGKTGFGFVRGFGRRKGCQACEEERQDRDRTQGFHGVGSR
jgi:hypothetical protein